MMHAERLFCTVGVHPTRCGDFESYSDGPEAYLQALLKLAVEGSNEKKVVAIGECGLDYDRCVFLDLFVGSTVCCDVQSTHGTHGNALGLCRLHFCDKDTQRKYFRQQFQLAAATRLPMFLHLRAAADDFMQILSEERSSMAAGVVHSFDGTTAEVESLLKFNDIYIGEKCILQCRSLRIPLA